MQDRYITVFYAYVCIAVECRLLSADTADKKTIAESKLNSKHPLLASHPP